VRVVVLGASGYLGRAVGDELLGRGHDVLGVSRSARASARLQAEGTTARADLVTATDAELDGLLAGTGAAVWCLGPDDRAPLPAPVPVTLERELVAPTVRAAAAARRAGLARFVILGSYFATFDRLHPAWGLGRRHPYIGARLAQAAGAEAAAAPGTVAVLEIPFVFGPVEGTVPLWKPLLFEPLRRSPVGFAPGGGSAAVTPADVARAAAAVVDGTAPAGRHPLSVDNISYRRLARLVLEELGRRRPVLPVPAPLVTAGAVATGAVHRLRGRGTGLHVRHVADDIVARDLHLDPEVHGRPLGLEPAPIDDAVRATVRAAYPGLAVARRE